jgi:hypothetical protein
MLHHTCSSSSSVAEIIADNEQHTMTPELHRQSQALMQLVNQRLQS